MNTPDAYQTDSTGEIYRRRADMVYRVCYSYLRSPYDAEDAAADTFVNLMRYRPQFQSEEHEKAWLIRAAINISKNMLKRSSRRDLPLGEFETLASPPEPSNEVLGAVLALPEKYRIVIYLHYYEGYKTAEIAKLLRCPDSTVRNRLSDARQILKLKLGDGFDE
ncbi:MAG: RNA polymerase sigma factor [Oscillospiraceae bacterium]|nr:RNA polymerase sigma factor [Oscillospiraceae bacterium]